MESRRVDNGMSGNTSRVSSWSCSPTSGFVMLSVIRLVNEEVRHVLDGAQVPDGDRRAVLTCLRADERSGSDQTELSSRVRDVQTGDLDSGTQGGWGWSGGLR